MLRRSRATLLAAVCSALPAAAVAADGPPNEYRPPSVPLVACNPLFSVWSNADHLTDDVTRHWTKKAQRLTSMIRVDGTPYRLMGDEPSGIEAMPQQGYATVLPTRSVYQFEGHGVHVTLTFFHARAADRRGRAEPAADVPDVAGPEHRRAAARGVGVLQRQQRAGRRPRVAEGRVVAGDRARAGGPADGDAGPAVPPAERRRQPDRLGVRLRGGRGRGRQGGDGVGAGVLRRVRQGRVAAGRRHPHAPGGGRRDADAGR